MTTQTKGPKSPEMDWETVPQGAHFVQVYQDESRLMHALAGFTGHALASGGLALVIATAAHRSSLRALLLARRHDLDPAQGSYVALDAADTLARFMVGGMPDPARFEATMLAVIGPARAAGRRVHAFGEMVALRWQQGDAAATLELERLWDAFCKTHGVTLFCAYPRIGATRDLGDSLAEACQLHEWVLEPA